MHKEEWLSLKERATSFETYWPTRLVILFDCMVLVVSWRLWGLGWMQSVLSFLLLSLALLHTYLLLHEAAHSTISRNRRVNSLIGHACGWLIVLPFLSRQRSHLLHHAWAGHPEGDPANKRIIGRFSVMTEVQAGKLERVWRNWLPLLTLNDRIGLWRDPFQHRRDGTGTTRTEREITAARLYFAGYICAVFWLASTGHLLFFLTWYVPAWAFQLVLEELINLPHHAETPLLKASDKALPLWEQDQVTHSCKTLPVWSSFVLLHFNLHTAHHLFPWLPWSGLPETHRLLLRDLPRLSAEQELRNELIWSLRNRKRPLLEIMGHYFDRIPRPERR
jgi:acyl-lipid omega-6 desaturase (Delta-12 desaturase)